MRPGRTSCANRSPRARARRARGRRGRRAEGRARRAGGRGGAREAGEGGRLGLDEAWEDVLRQQELLRKRAESKRQKAEDQETLWREFMETERREIVQRQNGQLARHLGEPLPGELPAALKQLAAHDQTQAERGGGALLSRATAVPTHSRRFPA